MTKPDFENYFGRTAAMKYRIRVAGALGEEWTQRVQGMALSVHRSKPEGCFTELVGDLADEAALMGVLEALYTHGARLLGVEHIDEDGTSDLNLDDKRKW